MLPRDHQRAGGRQTDRADAGRRSSESSAFPRKRCSFFAAVKHPFTPELRPAIRRAEFFNRAAQCRSADQNEPLRRKGDHQTTPMPLPPRPITDHDRDVLVTRSWFSRRHEGDTPAKIVAKLIAADRRFAAGSETGARFARLRADLWQNARAMRA